MAIRFIIFYANNEQMVTCTLTGVFSVFKKIQFANLKMPANRTPKSAICRDGTGRALRLIQSCLRLERKNIYFIYQNICLYRKCISVYCGLRRAKTRIKSITANIFHSNNIINEMSTLELKQL